MKSSTKDPERRIGIIKYYIVPAKVKFDIILRNSILFDLGNKLRVKTYVA